MIDLVFTYEQDYRRVMPAVIIAARASIPAIKNKTGSVIKAYTDARVSEVNENSLVYRMETRDGNLAGYFVLETTGDGSAISLKQKVLRPAFQQFDSSVSGLIAIFMGSSWKKDFLPN